MIQKDILELSGIFTINVNSGNQYKSTLNLDLLYRIYIYLYELCVFLFIATLSQLISTMVTLVLHSYDLFQLVLLVDKAYAIVNMIQVMNKETRAT